MIILRYIHSELYTESIYSYATSFSGYLILKCIVEHQNPFEKIALRCPVVNMADVLTGTLMKNDELEMILEGKKVQIGFDRKIEFIPAENADHRFQNPACMELATNKVLEFYEF